MKNNLSIIVAILIAVAFFASCKKDESIHKNTVVNNYSVTKDTVKVPVVIEPDSNASALPLIKAPNQFEVFSIMINDVEVMEDSVFRAQDVQGGSYGMKYKIQFLDEKNGSLIMMYGYKTSDSTTVQGVGYECKWTSLNQEATLINFVVTGMVEVVDGQSVHPVVPNLDGDYNVSQIPQGLRLKHINKNIVITLKKF